MDKIIKQPQASETRLFALILTFSGGFIDAFTYISGGHTMAAAQTGNIIFLSAALADHNFVDAANKLSALIAFVIGVAMVSVFHTLLHNNYWRAACLVPILIIGALIGLLPGQLPNYLVVPAVSFGLAMQNAAFSKIEGLGYNSVFTTGNVKKATVAWSEYYFHHDKSQKKAADNYLAIVLCFASGAIISAQLLPLMGKRTILVATFLIFVTDCSYYRQLFSRQ